MHPIITTVSQRYNVDAHKLIEYVHRAHTYKGNHGCTLNDTRRYVLNNAGFGRTTTERKRWLAFFNAMAAVFRRTKGELIDFGQ